MIAEKNEPIDIMVDESQAELDIIYNRFTVNGVHWCPLCRPLKKRKKQEEGNQNGS